MRVTKCEQSNLTSSKLRHKKNILSLFTSTISLCELMVKFFNHLTPSSTKSVTKKGGREMTDQVLFLTLWVKGIPSSGEHECTTFLANPKTEIFQHLSTDHQKPPSVEPPVWLKVGMQMKGPDFWFCWSWTLLSHNAMQNKHGGAPPP